MTEQHNGLFYNQNGVIVRRSTTLDVLYLSERLRQSDRDEVWASHHYTAWEALNLSLRSSVMSLTIEILGTPVGMFGINAPILLSDKAIIWFLASDGLDRIKIRFLKHSRKFIDMMLAFYPYLENHVDARNNESILWLKFCGAKIEVAEPHGMDQLPFHHFSFERT